MFPARTIALLLGCSISLLCFSVHLKVHGDVYMRDGQERLENVKISVYKNGSLAYSTTSNSKGKYEVSFENQGRYTVRFSYPGYASKSFAVDTRGPSWEGDNSRQRLYIGMTMVKRLQGFDLSLLEMPMGKARFDPQTGFVRWDKVWDERLTPKYKALMSSYDSFLRQREQGIDDRLANYPRPRF